MLWITLYHTNHMYIQS